LHTFLPLILLSALSAPPQFDVQLLDGSKVSGSLAGWTEKQVVVDTPAGRRELDVAKVASLAANGPTAKSAAKPSVWVDLADGSRLAASEYTTDKVRAKITLFPANEVFEVPTADVEAVRMQPESEATAIEWSRMRGKKLPGDLLVTGNQTGIDYHQGAIEDVSDAKVRFTLDGNTLGVKRTKVYGLIYYHAAGTPAADAPYTITETGGSRWTVASLKLDGDKLDFTTAGGRIIRRDLDQIAQIDLSLGKIVFLADLKPDAETVTANPFTLTEKVLPDRAEFSRVRRDENLDGKSLRTHNQEFHKGMAMRSRTELAWTLPGKFSRLEAVAGVDDDVRPLGNVRLKILGDGKSLLDANLSGGDKDARPIRLDVTGVRRLVLIVESLGNFGAGDHLDLGNLRLIK
jgi:hypothetical protein